MLKSILWGLGPSFLLLVFKLSVHLLTEGAHEPAWTEEVGSLIRVFAYVGMASIFVRVVLGHILEEVGPHIGRELREKLLPKMGEHLETFGGALIRVVENKEIILTPKSPVDVERIMDHDAQKSILKASGNDKDLQKAERALADGRIDDAIKVLEPLAATNPQKYTKHLLTALLRSPNNADTKRAETSLQAYGEAMHFQRAAYRNWKAGDTQTAIQIAEQGLSRADDDPRARAALRNSLAYYYAETDTKGDVALEYAEGEVSSRGAQSKTSPAYASSIDTRGFVRIKFGKTADEITAGMRDCMQAMELGVPQELYFKHVGAAQIRLQALRP